jgi:hypothetical protein
MPRLTSFDGRRCWRTSCLLLVVWIDRWLATEFDIWVGLESVCAAVRWDYTDLRYKPVVEAFPQIPF